jgi:hypothetical protein
MSVSDNRLLRLTLLSDLAPVAAHKLVPITHVQMYICKACG